MTRSTNPILRAALPALALFTLLAVPLTAQEVEPGTLVAFPPPFDIVPLEPTRCTVEALLRQAPVNPDGSFALRNVPAVPGLFRATVFCETPDGRLKRGRTRFIEPVVGGTTFAGLFRFEDEPTNPESIAITATPSTLDAAGTMSQLTVEATFTGGTVRDVTTEGTFYLSSNPAVLSVAADGTATAVGSGRAIVTAMHQGSITTVAIDVLLGDDADGDGLPDDYERRNASDPGGSNLALLTGAVARASSNSPRSGPELAIDGDLETSWFAALGDAANRRAAPFVEIELPFAAGVSQVRVLGHRSSPDGFDIFAGRFELFDAAGQLILATEELALPAPSRDLALPVELDGIARVRFVSTDDESPTPGLAELEVLSRAGGPGLDPADPSDAAADFDGDGLDNRQEFEAGTNPFAADSDGDGLTDGEELAAGSNPLLADSDGDGLADNREAGGDTDFDGLPDVLDADSDGDGLPDGVEERLGLDPRRADSDGDRLTDNAEDTDGDGIVNLVEVESGLDPGNADSDGDGLADGEEVEPGADGFVTEARDPDTDDDGMNDGFESRFGLDPTDPADAAGDLDGDGLSNLEEHDRGTDPTHPDVVPPRVVEVDPADGAVDHGPDAVIVVRFSEPLAEESLGNAAIELFAGTESVAGTTALSDDGLSVTFDPATTLLGETLHDLRVAGVRDRAGNLQAEVFASVFTTGVVIDDEAPRVVRTTVDGLDLIGPNDVPVPINSVLEVEFSERIDPSTLDAGTWTVTDTDANLAVRGQVQVDAGGRRAVFVPDVPFAVGRRHTLLLSTAVTDLAGNRLAGTRSFRFLTAIQPDAERPRILLTSPGANMDEVPLNALVRLRASEPLLPLSALAGLRLELGGVPVAGSVSLSDGNRRLTFTSQEALLPRTEYEIVITGELLDLAGQPVELPRRVRFRTGDQADLSRPASVAAEPLLGSVGVARDAEIAFDLDAPIDPTSLGTSVVTLRTNAGTVPAELTASDDRRRIFVTPRGGLLDPETRYQLNVSQYEDLSGNRNLNGTFTNFTTGREVDTEPPRVERAGPSDGTIEVPVNAQVSLLFSEPLAVASAVDGAVSLVAESGPAAGQPVAGAIALIHDRSVLRFTPAAPLRVATTYRVELGAVTDRSGNVAVPFSVRFTTGADPAPDTAGPRVIDAVPSNGAVEVDPAAPIVLTFDETLDATTVNERTVVVRFLSNSQTIAGDFAVDGAVVTFTPSVPIPLGSRILVQLVTSSFAAERVLDLAGNPPVFFSSSFTVQSGSDDEPPRVIAVSPPDGAVDVGPDAEIVLTFSEPVRVPGGFSVRVALFADGESLPVSLRTSTDGLTLGVRVSAGLPSESEIAVATTDLVTDLAGNPVVPFTSRFTTLPRIDLGRPGVATQRPPSGANNVRPGLGVVLFTSEPLDPATVDEGFVVSENGVVVPGEVAITAGGAAFRFVPTVPFAETARVDVFLTADARDPAGNEAAPHHGFFTVGSDPRLGRPVLVRSNPPRFEVLPRNTVLEAEFDEALDPASVNASTVILRQGSSVIETTIELVESERVIRVTPTEPLIEGLRYLFDLGAALRDLDGETLGGFGRRVDFEAGAEIDDVAPALIAASPPADAAGVPVNARLRLLFDERLNPVSISESTVRMIDEVGETLIPCTIFLSTDRREITVVPHAPLADDAFHLVSVDGVRDVAGNPVAPFELAFTTSAAADVTAPREIGRNPRGQAVEVPTNTELLLEYDEPIDAVSVARGLSAGVSLGPAVLGRREVRGERLAALVPDQALPASERLFLGGNVTDWAGHRVQRSEGFNTGSAADFEPPVVVSISPSDGDSGVPLNARLRIEFDEPMQGVALDGVAVLRDSSGEIVPARLEVTDERILELVPLLPLQPLESHVLRLEGARDVAGNALSGSVEVGFTTGEGISF